MNFIKYFFLGLIMIVSAFSALTLVIELVAIMTKQLKAIL